MEEIRCTAEHVSPRCPCGCHQDITEHGGQSCADRFAYLNARAEHQVRRYRRTGVPAEAVLPGVD